MISGRIGQFAIAFLAAGLLTVLPLAQAKEARPRVVVLSDIGGTDPDDFQSMVHLLLCSDQLQLEGLISSPYGPGRKQHILEVLSEYEKDFPNLSTWSRSYPTPSYLRSISKQGALESSGPAGFQEPSEGSRWLISLARMPDPRPLFVLVWGGIDDLAQALHDAPAILPKLRVYWIGGPNKMWSVNAYDYIEQHHPKLWMIESNSTYRGWFTGGDQSGEWSNQSFVTTQIAGRGALGNYFSTKLGGVMKMGDSPSVSWLIHGNNSDPTQPGWGGSYIRVWDDRKTVFDRLTTAADLVETFGVVEFLIPMPSGFTAWASTTMVFDNRVAMPGGREGNRLRFRFSPRDSKVWSYAIKSPDKEIDGKSGQFTAVQAPLSRTSHPSITHPNWWTDNQDPSLAEGVHAGARTVSSWRLQFLRDFAGRLRRCSTPATK